ncbi:Uncharacterised protein [Mycobacteroides abscessus subsp. abscessus]|nr:Uncharacterised protein [Mycobacteroides abscessus subsp. abscessus]
MAGIPPQDPNDNYPIGFHTPYYQGAMQPTINPYPLQYPVPIGKKMNPWVKAAIAIAAIIAAISTAEAVYVYYTYQRFGDASKRMSDSGASTTTTELDNATVEQFYSNKFTDEQRVDWAWARLNRNSTETGYEDKTILQMGNKHAGEFVLSQPGMSGMFAAELEKPSEDMSTGALLTTLEAAECALEMSSLPTEDRVKMAAAIVDDSADAYYETLKTAISNKDVRSRHQYLSVNISALNNKPVESPVFRRGTLGNGYSTAGAPTKVAAVSEFINGKEGLSYMFVWRFIDGKPILNKSYSNPSADAKAIGNPQDIPAS